MSKKVGVMLAGCGYEDGSEVYEAVLTILALERAGAQVRAIAPDMDQYEVINHYTGHQARGESLGPASSVISQSARIVRGKITSVKEVSGHDFDALIIPGGFGVVKNLCTWYVDNAEDWVHPEVSRLITEMHSLEKPIGALCIAPMLVAMVLGDKSPTLTIGNDGKVALALQKKGARHQETGLNEIAVDTTNKIVTTAAFMLAANALEAETGINKLVQKVLELAT